MFSWRNKKNVSTFWFKKCLIWVYVSICTTTSTFYIYGQHMKKVISGFLVCGSLNVHAQYPTGAKDMYFLPEAS